MDQLIRAVEACRAAGMRIAADDVGRRQRRPAAAVASCGSTSSRSTSRWSRVARSGPRPRRSCEPSRTSPTAGARWSSPRASRPRNSWSSSARWASAPARAICWDGRPNDRRPTPVDLDALVRREHGAVHPTISGRCPPDRTRRRVATRPTGQDHRVNVDGHPNPARLPPLHGHRPRTTWRPTLGLFDRQDRRTVAVVMTTDGRRVHMPVGSTGLDPRIAPCASSLASRGLMAFSALLPAPGGRTEERGGTERERHEHRNTEGTLAGRRGFLICPDGSGPST